MVEKLTHYLNRRKTGERISKPILPLLTGGILIGVNEVIFAISVSGLIFSGELAPTLPQGIGIALVTATITIISIALLSAIPGVIGSLQDGSAVILSLIAATLVKASPGLVTENEIQTILVIIPIATLLTGALFLGLGFLKMGGLVRFFPYPVVGGFLAGTGWLLLQGSVGAMADYSLTWDNLKALMQPNQVALWAPGMLFALMLFGGMKRYKHYLTMPIILIAAICLFYVGLLVAGISIDQATQRGLLLGGLGEEITWKPLELSYLRDADWVAILSQGGNIAIILVLSLLSLLLNASALELSTEKDIDFDRELRAAGAANLLSGIGGGMVGFHTLSTSILSYRIGGRSRAVGLLAGLFCGLMLITGPRWLYLFPKAILGGLLAFLGIEFLDEWVVRGRSKLLPLDYWVVVGILGVIAATNFLMGVAVGLMATILLFVVNYSQVKIVRHALSGADMQSNVERTDSQRKKLKALGAHILILELQGFIFFGTANSLFAQIKGRLSDHRQTPIRYILLDFGRVNGLDSSAVFSFIKCRQIGEVHEAILILTGLSERISCQLKAGGLFTEPTRVLVFPDLDRGLEWCEDELLDSAGLKEIVIPVTLSDRLVEAGFKQAEVCKLIAYLERIELGTGDYLVHQGDESNALYLIDHGKFSVYLENENRLRLQTTGNRTMIGEIGVYLGTNRTASVIAEDSSVVYKLSKAALAEMRANEPGLAAAFHEFAAYQLAERLLDTTRLVSMLSK